MASSNGSLEFLALEEGFRPRRATLERSVSQGDIRPSQEVLRRMRKNQRSTSMGNIAADSPRASPRASREDLRGAGSERSIFPLLKRPSGGPGPAITKPKHQRSRSLSEATVVKVIERDNEVITITKESKKPSGRARTISQTSMSSVGSRGSDSDQDGGSGPSRGLRRSVSASSSIMMVKLPFKRKLIKLHSTVVHDAHHDDPAHHAHFYHEHVEVSSEELFFDLLFVALSIELSGFLKADLSFERIIMTFGLFATAWLTWFHMNILLTRFSIHGPWIFVIFFVMLGTLGFAVHAVDEGDPSGLKDGIGGDNSLPVFLSLLVSRVAYLAIYIAIVIKLPLARPMIWKYVACLSVSSVLILAAALVPSTTATIVLWVLGLLVEFLMYPLGLLTKYEYQLSVNTAHLLERNQLWIILILGEGIISIVSVVHEGGFGSSYYGTEISAFLIIYWLMLLFIRSQLEFDVSAEEHALDHSGMLGLAVALKLGVLHSQDNKYKRSYAWLFTGSLGLTLFVMNLGRLTHKSRPFDLFGSPHGKTIILTAHLALTACVVPLALAVDENPDGIRKQEFGSAKLFGTTAALLVVMLFLEMLEKFHDEEEELEEREEDIQYLRDRETQTDLSMVHKSPLRASKSPIVKSKRFSSGEEPHPNIKSILSRSTAAETETFDEPEPPEFMAINKSYMHAHQPENGLHTVASELTIKTMINTALNAGDRGVLAPPPPSPPPEEEEAAAGAANGGHRAASPAVHSPLRKAVSLSDVFAPSDDGAESGSDMDSSWFTLNLAGRRKCDQGTATSSADTRNAAFDPAAGAAVDDNDDHDHDGVDVFEPEAAHPLQDADTTFGVDSDMGASSRSRAPRRSSILESLI